MREEHPHETEIHHVINGTTSAADYWLADQHVTFERLAPKEHKHTCIWHFRNNISKISIPINVAPTNQGYYCSGLFDIGSTLNRILTGVVEEGVKTLYSLSIGLISPLLSLSDLIEAINGPDPAYRSASLSSAIQIIPSTFLLTFTSLFWFIFNLLLLVFFPPALIISLLYSLFTEFILAIRAIHSLSSLHPKQNKNEQKIIS